MDLVSEQNPADDIQDLVWALLDEQISEGDLARLETRLRGDEDVRQLYLQCVQMHADLQQWFGATESVKSDGLPVEMIMPNLDQIFADPAP